MVNVVNKMCEVPNCFKRPSLNYPGVRPAVRCGEHKLEGMTNAFRKSVTPKASSDSNESPQHRARSSDGDTTDSGSDADDSCPVVSEPPSGSTKTIKSPNPSTAAADAASPSSKPKPAAGESRAASLCSAAASPSHSIHSAGENAKRARWGSGTYRTYLSASLPYFSTVPTSSQVLLRSGLHFAHVGVELRVRAQRRTGGRKELGVLSGTGSASSDWHY